MLILSTAPTATIFTLSAASIIVLVALILTILALDIFFQADILSLLGLLGVSIYIALSFDIALEWKLLWTIIIWLLTSFFFYFGWRVIAKPLCDLITPKIETCAANCKGQTGTFRSISGKAFCHWNGDLWPINCNNSDDYFDGEEILILGIDAGKLSITKKTNKP